MGDVVKIRWPKWLRLLDVQQSEAEIEQFKDDARAAADNGAARVATTEADVSRETAIVRRMISSGADESEATAQVKKERDGE